MSEQSDEQGTLDRTIVNNDGEAECPRCGGSVSRLVPTTRIESIWFSEADSPTYDTEDYDDELSAATFECDDCNAWLLLPQPQEATDA